MRYLLIILAFVGCSIPKGSQRTSVTDYAGSVYLDKFDNAYVLNSDYEIVRYDSDGKLLFDYSNRRVGNITHMDVSNPQLPIAFVPVFGTIITLDNTLAELSTLSLTELGYNDISTVAVSNDGNYWLYDEANWRLVKVDREGSILYESNRLSDFLPQQSPAVYMLERENKVFVSDQSGAVHLFDNLGSYIKSLPLSGIGKFSVRNGEILYLSADGPRAYHLTYFTTRTLTYDSPEYTLIDMSSTTKSTVYLTTEGQILR